MCSNKFSYTIIYLNSKLTWQNSQTAGTHGHISWCTLITAEFYLIGLLPAVGAATVRGPQVTAPPLGSYCSQPSRAPRCAVQMPGCFSAPPSGKDGSPGDRSIMVPLAQVMLLIAVVTVGVPAEGIWHLLTVPPSIQVHKAALLFAQVSSHATATQH